MPARSPLAVWLYGTVVAVLEEDGDRLRMSWEPEAAQRWPINSTVLSTLLPLVPSSPPAPARVRAFFGGLLPEGNARTQLALDAGVLEDDVFGMLKAYGRDVAGALVIAPQGEDPADRHEKLVPITDVAIAEKLARAQSNAAPLGVESGVNSLSLAGMQPKIALHRVDGQWLDCRGGAPSTFIVKPGRASGEPTSDLIYNEAFCLRMARRLGLTTIEADVVDFAGRSALVVSRYDRAVEDEVVRRIHQEDCAQALGINTQDPARKFQYGRDLPSLRHIAAILDRELAPVTPLLDLTVFNIAVGNTDAHAKNIALLHGIDGEVELAPAYDLSPHRHYPTAGDRSAMDIAGRQEIDAITTRDLAEEAAEWGLRRRVDVSERIEETLESLRNQLLQASEDDRAGVPEPVFETILRRTAALLAGQPAGSAE